MKGLATIAALATCIACVADELKSPPAADGSDTSALADADVDEAECRTDRECSGGDACQRGRCDAGRCALAPVDCDDGDDCTVDTCDAAIGCVRSPAPESTPCTTGGGSESCVGDVYHFQDRCDGQGRCVDKGREDCAQLPGGGCFRYTCVATTAGVGCDIVTRVDGTPCAADGLSDECFEGAQHGADVCVAGECVDAGASACPTAFCEEALCTAAGDCAARAIGVERALSGDAWRLIELYAAGSPEAPHVGAVDYALAFGDDGRVTTYGALPSVPQAAPPGDGDYCVTADGDLRFALPFGAAEGAPRKQYRGVFSGGDDFAVAFREGEPSLGVLVRLPEGDAPKLVGDYRMVGLLRRNVIGVRAVLGRVGFDADGCLRGGVARFSDELEERNIPAGECVGSFVWLIGLRLDFDGETYFFRGTANHGGDVAVLTLHTDQTTVGEALVLLVRELDFGDGARAGEHVFARLDVDDEVASAARGRATVDVSNEYVRYQESALDGTHVVGPGGIFPVPEVPGAYREVSGELRGEERTRMGQAGEIILGRIGFFIDVRVPETMISADAFPLGASLRIGIVRP